MSSSSQADQIMNKVQANLSSRFGRNVQINLINYTTPKSHLIPVQKTYRVSMDGRYLDVSLTVDFKGSYCWNRDGILRTFHNGNDFEADLVNYLACF